MDIYFDGEMATLTNKLGQCGTLLEAIETLNRLLPRWVGKNRVWVVCEGQTAWVCNDAPDGFELQRDVAIQVGVFMLIALVRMAAGPDWKPRQVKLEMKPNNHHAGVEALSDAEVFFHPTLTAVAFPSKLLQQPLKHTP